MTHWQALDDCTLVTGWLTVNKSLKGHIKIQSSFMYQYVQIFFIF